jgi:hypothetical protein
LKQIIRDTKRTDFYLDAFKAREYGLIDNVLGPMETVRPEPVEPLNAVAGEGSEPLDAPQIAASERSPENLSRN